MRTHGMSFKTISAIAALAIASAACGGSESREPSETATTESVASAPADTNPVVGSTETADPDSAVDTTAAPVTDVASTEPTDAQACPEPDSTGPALEVGVVAQFDSERGENPEGLAFDTAGNAHVSFAPLGQIVRLTDDGAGAETVGAIPGWDDPFPGLGDIEFDANGHLYAAVGGGATSGVWIFECADGEPTRIAGTEAIGLPNALALDSVGNLYVTDSNSGVDDDQAALGAVWRISPDGTIVRWAEDILLGGTDAIGIGPIGANGLAIDGDRVYVAVTEKASIVEIPILEDGAAGPVSVVATGEALTFVEGVAVRADGALFAAEAFTNSVVAIGPDGTVTPIAAGLDGDIDQPANIVVGVGSDSSTRLYVTNNARFSNLEGGIGPSIVAIDTESA